jgi:plastocyanin
MDNKHLKFLMVMLTMLALGSILLVACSRPGTTTGGATAAGTQQPQSGTPSSGGGGSNTVHMGNNNFTQPSITIAKGSKITLVDDAAVPHIIQNGTWNGSTPQPMKELGAPTVNQNFSGNDTHDVGPFTTAGTFKLYCTIHVGMNLTVTVK